MFNVKVIGGDKVYKTNPASATEGEGVAVVASGRGRLFDVRCVNTSAAEVWLQVFDAVAAPAAGAEPVAMARIPANYEGNLPWITGLPFGTGLVVAVSVAASPFQYDGTLAASTAFFFTVNYN